MAVDSITEQFEPGEPKLEELNGYGDILEQFLLDSSPLKRIIDPKGRVEHPDNQRNKIDRVSLRSSTNGLLYIIDNVVHGDNLSHERDKKRYPFILSSHIHSRYRDLLRFLFPEKDREDVDSNIFEYRDAVLASIIVICNELGLDKKTLADTRRFREQVVKNLANPAKLFDEFELKSGDAAYFVACQLLLRHLSGIPKNGKVNFAIKEITNSIDIYEDEYPSFFSPNRFTNIEFYENPILPLLLRRGFIDLGDSFDIYNNRLNGLRLLRSAMSVVLRSFPVEKVPRLKYTIDHILSNSAYLEEAANDYLESRHNRKSRNKLRKSLLLLEHGVGARLSEILDSSGLLIKTFEDVNEYNIPDEITNAFSLYGKKLRVELVEKGCIPGMSYERIKLKDIRAEIVAVYMTTSKVQPDGTKGNREVLVFGAYIPENSEDQLMALCPMSNSEVYIEPKVEDGDSWLNDESNASALSAPRSFSNAQIAQMELLNGRKHKRS